MTREAAGQEEDGVDANIVAVAHEPRRQPFGRNRHAAQAILVEGHGGALFAGSRLHLDKGNDAAAAGDEIDFAAGHAGADGENPPAMQPQPPGGQPLGAAAALLGELAAVQRLSSKARA